MLNDAPGPKHVASAHDAPSPRLEARLPASPAAVVFDFDGVIANSEPLHLHAFREVLRSIGIELPVEEYDDRYLGFDDEGAIGAVMAARGREVRPATVQALVEAKAELLPRMLSAPDVLVQGAAACIARMAEQVPLAIASGARRDEIELVLGAHGLRRFFAVIVAAGETARFKPWPDPYAAAIAQLESGGRLAAGTAPARCVAVEDSHWGIESARAAGLRCIGLATSYPRDALTGADHVIDGLDALTPELLAAVVRGAC